MASGIDAADYRPDTWLNLIDRDRNTVMHSAAAYTLGTGTVQVRSIFPGLLQLFKKFLDIIVEKSFLAVPMHKFNAHASVRASRRERLC
ncbi:hypothetical protein LPU83_pLPU83b_0577 (plasmid) [Rhizobium favelukesii]|uniref:Uncharacterized protein n=1 Tax=Rhizobium favelukesii TaxID=348824 RepID=W6RHA2_9HYPH|nr:hypothetical protein LPU83_pLPU83b_0577 [Rhizobium favelukesii]